MPKTDAAELKFSNKSPRTAASLAAIAEPAGKLRLFARDMETRTADQFVGMYVNHHTVDCGEDVPKAAQLLMDLGFQAGIIPTHIKVEFVR